MSYRKPYLESCVFIHWITGERPERQAIIQTVIDAAEEGQFPIVTASWTIVEVHKKKGFSTSELTDKQSSDVLPYFRESYIELVEVDRLVAERAHELCRQFPNDGANRILRPGDAVHIAAAERAGCDVILSYDPDLLKLKYTGIPIEEPQAIGKKALGAGVENANQLTLLPPEAGADENGKG